MHSDPRDIRNEILAQLQHSDPVRKALKQLASRGVTKTDEIKAIATDDRSGVDSRIDAIIAILAVERGAEEVLCDLLDTEDRTVFVETLKVIASLHPRWALPELMTRLKTCVDPRKRALFAWVLAAYPKDGDAERLLRDVMVTDPDAVVREHAIEAMGVFESDKTVNALLAALETGSERERFWALYSLGNLARPETADVIRKYLQDHTAIAGFGTVSDEARQALAKIRNRESNR